MPADGPLIMEQILQHPQGMGEASVVIVILWALSACFFGYILLRLELIPLGMIIGAVAASAVVSRYRHAPAGLDYFVACIAAAVILGMLAWFLYRLFFALSSGVCLTCAIVMRAGAVESVPAWVLAGILGLALAFVVFVFMKPLVIFLTSLIGSLVAVLLTALVVSGRLGPMAGSPPDAGMSMPSAGPLVVLAVVVIVVAVAGMYVQVKVSHGLRIAMVTPEESKTGKKGSRGKTGKGRRDVHPRFTKI